MKAFPALLKFLLVLSVVIVSANQSYSEEDVLSFKKLGTLSDGYYIQKTFSNIINQRLSNPYYLPRKNMSPDEYDDGLYSRAWLRVRSYYPNRFMYIQNDDYFMMHGLHKGRICIEVYQTEVLAGIISNQKTFNSRTIVNAYNQLKNNPSEKEEFEAKMGKLSGYFESEAAHRQLYKYLGKRLYQQLMNALREENSHLLAGALIHEGMHALVSDRATANIQNDFNNGRLSMELNELRSYMAEIIYHCQYCKWARENIDDHWDDIAGLIEQLENLRREKPPPVTNEEKEKIEEIKAKIKAHIALLRVRLREIKKSAERMDFLMNNYRKNYMQEVDPGEDKIDPDKKLKENFEAMAVAVSAFRQATEKYAAEVEKALKNLENILDLWNEWADCTIEEPPPPKETKELIDSTQNKPFPDPPVETAREIKTKAEEEMGRNYSMQGEKTGNQPDSEDYSHFGFSGGIGYAFTSMEKLNDYFDYLNNTWNGSIASIKHGSSFSVGIDYYFLKNFGVGVGFENITVSSEGILQTYDSRYSNKNKANGINLSLLARSNPIIERFSFTGSIGMGYFFSHYTETEDDFVTEGSATAPGFKISGGFEYMLTSFLGIQALTGYRSLAGVEHDVKFFLPEEPPVSLDYSGLSGEIRMIIKY